MPSTTKPKLKIGLLLDEPEVPNWVFRMVERIVNSDYGRIVLTILMDENEKDSFQSHNNRWGSLLYYAYTNINHLINRADPDSNERVDLLPTLRNANTIHIEPEKVGCYEMVSEEDLRRIRDFDLDVIIDLGHRSYERGIFDCSKYGVWSYYRGDGERYTTACSGFYEFFGDSPIACVRVISEDPCNAIEIFRSYGSTAKKSVELHNNSNNWKSASFIPRKLEALYKLGEQGIAVDGGMNNPKSECSALAIPSNLEFLKLYLPRLNQRLKGLPKLLAYRKDWALQFKIDNEPSTSFQDFKSIFPPLYTWWADPNIAYEDDHHYVFVEEAILGYHRAHISVIKIDGEGRWSGPWRVLEKPYHLSYPFVFRHENKFYMVPESAQNRSIDLYEAEDFPLKWKLRKTIMSGVRAYDSTLLHRDGIWWLFCTMVENEGASYDDELFLFYSDDLFSDHWEAHPMNPIVSDVRSARPAGAIFENDHSLFRPSQDCSKCYGYAVNINRIEELSEKAYKEVRVKYLEPNWSKRISQVHTLNYLHGLTVIDVYLERIRIGWPISGSKKMLSQFLSPVTSRL